MVDMRRGPSGLWSKLFTGIGSAALPNSLNEGENKYIDKRSREVEENILRMAQEKAEAERLAEQARAQAEGLGQPKKPRLGPLNVEVPNVAPESTQQPDPYNPPARSPYMGGPPQNPDDRFGFGGTPQGPDQDAQYGFGHSRPPPQSTGTALTPIDVNVFGQNQSSPQDIPGMGENPHPDITGGGQLGLGINDSQRGNYPTPPMLRPQQGMGENPHPDVGGGQLGLGINDSQPGTTPEAKSGWWDKMKGNSTALWTAGSALAGLLQHLGREKEHKRKDKIAATAARWSPVTGDNTWQNQAYATRPNLANALTQGALSGYMTGESIRKGKQQEDWALEDREARRRLFADNPEAATQYYMNQMPDRGRR